MEKTMVNIDNNFVNGTWIPSVGGAAYGQKNPADLQEATGIWQKSRVEDLRAAAKADAKAYN